MTRSVNREKQVDNAVLFALVSISLVQAFVAMLSWAPNLVFDAAMDVIFRIRLDDKESGWEWNKMWLNES